MNYAILLIFVLNGFLYSQSKEILKEQIKKSGLSVDQVKEIAKDRGITDQQIKNEFGGFSSYQSEYPYEMTIKNGSVLSPLSILLNNRNDYNFIFSYMLSYTYSIFSLFYSLYSSNSYNLSLTYLYDFYICSIF